MNLLVREGNREQGTGNRFVYNSFRIAISGRQYQKIEDIPHTKNLL
jgi:hypothetical protein